MKQMNRRTQLLMIIPLLLAACSDDEQQPVDLSYTVPMQDQAYWPKFRRTASNSGWSPVRKGTGQAKVWSYTTGRGIFSSPVIDKDGVIYIGSADAYFYAIKPDGTLKWRKKLGELVDSAAVIGADGGLFFGSGDGHLYSVDSAGKERWKFKPQGGAFITWFEGNVVMGPDGTLYAGNDDFRMYAVNPKTGKQLWALKGTDQIWSAGAFAPDGTLYYGANDLVLRAVDPVAAAANPTDVEKKALRWRAPTLGSVVSSPLVAKSGRLIFGSFDGYIHGVDKKGKELWKVPAREHIYASAAQAPDGTIYVPSADGTLYAIDDDGKVKWTFDTLDPIRSSPAIDGDGTIYFGSGDGRLYAVNPDGTRRWSFDTSADDRNDLNSSPALGPDAIYIAGEDGKLWSVPYDYCLRTKDDKRCSIKATEDMPADGAHVMFLTPGGSTVTRRDKPVSVGEAIALRLLVRKKGDTVDAAMDPDTLKVTVTPAFAHTVKVAADGSFLTIVSAAPLAFGTTYKVAASGKYLVDGTRMGNAVTGGVVGGSFDSTLELKTAAQVETTFPLEGDADQVPVLDLVRLAAPQPTMLPSYNQIGFDFMHLLIGFIQLDPKKGTALAWVVAGKPKGQEVEVDVSDDQKILFPLSGQIKGGAFVLSSSSFAVEFGNVSVPLDFLRVGGTINDKGINVGGLSVTGHTTCKNVEYYGSLLKLAGLCNPKTDQLVIFGTALLDPVGDGGDKPTGLTVETPALVEATDKVDGTVTVKLGGTLPDAKKHRVSILLLDTATGQPYPLDYSQKTRATVTGGKIASVTLSFPVGKKVVKGQVEAIVIHDLFPVGRFKL